MAEMCFFATHAYYRQLLLIILLVQSTTLLWTNINYIPLLQNRPLNFGAYWMRMFRVVFIIYMGVFYTPKWFSKIFPPSIDNYWQIKIFVFYFKKKNSFKSIFEIFSWWIFLFTNVSFFFDSCKFIRSKWKFQVFFRWK